MNIIITLSVALSAAPPAAGPAELEGWVSAARGKLADTPTSQAIRHQREAASAGVDAALQQAPWSVRSLLTHGQQFPRNGTSFVPRIGMSLPTSRSWESTLSGAVQYQNRSRWAVLLEGATGYFDDPMVDGVQPNDIPFTVDLSVTYDVIGGGSGSAENEAARSEALFGVGQRLSARDGLLQAELRLLEQVVALFGNQCKRQQVERIRVATTRALEEARLQVETKVISKADALNFEFLADSVNSRHAALELEARSLLQQISAWGPDMAATFEALAARPSTCEEPMAATLDRARRTRSDAATLDTLAASLPGPAASRAAETAAGLSIAAIEAGQRPSVAPFLLGRVSRAIGLDEEVALIEGGVSLEWSLAGDRGDALVRAARARRAAAGRSAEERTLAARAAIRQLAAEIDAEQALLRTLHRTVEHTGQLGEILEVRRAIGEVSSLNQAIAISNEVDARLAYVDSWLRLRLGLIRLETLERTAKEAEPDLARATDTAWTD